MITISKMNIHDIPVLQIAQTEKMNHPLPTIVYYHGYNGEKESSLTIAYKIAEKGFRVILPDSILHGERKKALSTTEMDVAFWEIVFQNIKELDEIRQYLKTNDYLLSDRIGIGGTSMGGITSYAALATYPWIKAATILMGTPLLTQYAQILIDRFHENNEERIDESKIKTVETILKTNDISLQPEKLQNRPLFIWHGDQDQIVPVQHSEAFYSKVHSLYTKKDNIRFIKEPGRTHNISKLSIEETAQWFHTHL